VAPPTRRAARPAVALARVIDAGVHAGQSEPLLSRRTRTAAHLDDRAALDAHVHWVDEGRQPVARRPVAVVPSEVDAVARGTRQRGPDPPAVDHVPVTVLHCLRVEVGQLRAGLRLGGQLPQTSSPPSRGKGQRYLCSRRRRGGSPAQPSRRRSGSAADSRQPVWARRRPPRARGDLPGPGPTRTDPATADRHPTSHPQSAP
jgi:hypothetical protein